jgi:fatty acid desaturase
MTETRDDNAKLIESLLERAAEYGKTTFELVKLKTLDKTSDVVSSFTPHSIVFFMVLTFLFFFNLGIAFWVGDILGKTFFGFFIVAAFYGVIGIVIHFFMHKRIKKMVGDYFIKQVLKN